jgi:hypothetical protein
MLDEHEKARGLNSKIMTTRLAFLLMNHLALLSSSHAFWRCLSHHALSGIVVSRPISPTPVQSSLQLSSLLLSRNKARSQSCSTANLTIPASSLHQTAPTAPPFLLLSHKPGRTFRIAFHEATREKREIRSFSIHLQSQSPKRDLLFPLPTSFPSVPLHHHKAKISTTEGKANRLEHVEVPELPHNAHKITHMSARRTLSKREGREKEAREQGRGGEGNHEPSPCNRGRRTFPWRP